MFAIDVNTSFGESPRHRTDLSLASLVEALDSHHIGLAFTHSWRGVRYSYSEANTETLEVAQVHPGLLPAATLDLRHYLGCECLTLHTGYSQGRLQWLGQTADSLSDNSLHTGG